MLTQLLIALNGLASAVAKPLLMPVAWCPGWLSITAIGAVTGIAMLVAFKYTSNQSAIRATRDRIKANLLALALFRDDIRVGLRCQGALLLGAANLLILSIVPMLVMFPPMCLLLAQLALWYQVRPLAVGEQAVVTVRLAEDRLDRLSAVQMGPSSSALSRVGPIRVPAQGIVCWSVEAREPGLHRLAFDLDGAVFSKELSVAVGGAWMPTSMKRPDRGLFELLLHPRERPFTEASPVRSIEIEYPERSSWTAGSRTWLVYWFVISLAAAFAARPVFGVHM
ncbi:MAG: hypothetical protein FJ297_08780 [Planctomycetes bacterium]|nr:hypothetical protein [Planctomycetota bacterium]